MRSQEESNPAQAFAGHLQQPAQPQPAGGQQQQGQQHPQGPGQQQPFGGKAPRGRGQRGGHGGRGQHGRGGRGQRGRSYGQYQLGHAYAPHFGYGYPPSGYFPGGAPHAGILGAPGSAGMSVQSNFYTYALSTFSTNHGYAGSSPVEGNSVPPPVVCQICYAPGHPASTCPSRFVQPTAPALGAQTPDASNLVWYPDSGASAHMTPHSRILSHKSFSLN
ncbi:unnamed protein product, partial [Cuscuta europaea]